MESVRVKQWKRGFLRTIKDGTTKQPIKMKEYTT